MKVLIDTMNLVFISFNVAKTNAIKDKGEFLEEDIGLFYHLFFNKLNEIAKEYGQFIACSEGRNSLDWRRTIYPLYKRNRDKSKTDETYKIIKNEFDEIERLLKMYPTKYIATEFTEADDSIHVLATHFADLGEDVLVISGDGDMTQLYNYNNKIKIYNPMKRTIVYPRENILEFKTIVGDPADGISGIPRLGKVTFEKMMLDRTLYEEKLKGKEDLYNQIMNIVDLRRLPQEYQQSILNDWNNTPWNEFDPESIEAFMTEKKLVQHITYWYNNVSDIYTALRDDEDIKITGDMLDTIQTDSKDDFLDIDELLKTLEG